MLILRDSSGHPIRVIETYRAGQGKPGGDLATPDTDAPACAFPADEDAPPALVLHDYANPFYRDDDLPPVREELVDTVLAAAMAGLILCAVIGFVTVMRLFFG